MSDTNAVNTAIIEEFRANEGRVGGGFTGAPMLLLHTTGAKSGAERVNPVVYLEHDGKVYVFASKAGADNHPDWYVNLRANPVIEVELGSATLSATARILPESERALIYAEQASRMPGFEEYQNKTTRVIPVVELELRR